MSYRDELIEQIMECFGPYIQDDIDKKACHRELEWVINNASPGIDIELMKDNNFIYDRRFGTIAPDFGMHQATIGNLFCAHNPMPDNTKVEGAHQRVKDLGYHLGYVGEIAQAMSKFDPFEPWININGNATSPSLTFSDIVICVEEKLTIEEYEAFREAGRKIVNYREWK